MSTADTPSWGHIAENLTRAIVIAREAHKETRRRRPRLTDNEIEHIRSCELEIAGYLRRAREAIAQTSSDLAADEATWRRIVLTLFRAHSLTWEVLWYTYEGLPLTADGSGLGECGEELTQYVVDAVRALTARETDLSYIDWNGRPIRGECD